MIHFQAKLAGVPFEAAVRFSQTALLCRDYFTTEAPRFSVCIDDAALAFERIASEETARREGRAPEDFSDEQLEFTALYRLIAEQLLDDGILLFHASAIAVDGRTYLFTARSGTGKSTHTRLWRTAFGQRAVMVNDDKPLLLFRPDGVFACGTPWNGKHRLSTNTILPVQALCLLTRSETNHIQRISAQEALPALFQQCYHSDDPAHELLVLELLDKLCQAVPFYRLGCNMDPEAAQVAFAGMQEVSPS